MRLIKGAVNVATVIGGLIFVAAVAFSDSADKENERTGPQSHIQNGLTGSGISDQTYSKGVDPNVSSNPGNQKKYLYEEFSEQAEKSNHDLMPSDVIDIAVQRFIERNKEYVQYEQGVREYFQSYYDEIKRRYSLSVHVNFKAVYEGIYPTHKQYSDEIIRHTQDHFYVGILKRSRIRALDNNQIIALIVSSFEVMPDYLDLYLGKERKKLMPERDIDRKYYHVEPPSPRH